MTHLLHCCTIIINTCSTQTPGSTASSTPVLPDANDSAAPFSAPIFQESISPFIPPITLAPFASFASFASLSPFIPPITFAPFASPGILTPVLSTETLAPVLSTETLAPVLSTETLAPVVSTETLAPVVSIETLTPVVSTETLAPVVSTETLTPVVSTETLAPVTPDTLVPTTKAPVPTTKAPVPATPSPVHVTPAPVPDTRTPTRAPIPATPAPVPQSVPVDSGTSSPLAIRIAEVALDGGASLADPTSYQSKALAFAEGVTSATSIAESLQYYALACIWYATSGVSNPQTIAVLGNVALPGWLSTTNWVTDSSFCTWFGITCVGGNVSAIELISNRLYGSFPAEVTLLDGTLELIDLFGNEYLYNNGAEGNDFFGDIPSLKYLYYGTTAFSYPGIPSAIAKLTNLVEYDCSFSLYNGPIPNIFAPLTNLNYLDMGDNDWRGNGIPASLIALPNLQYFYFDNTYTDATLDFMLGMPKISELWADYTLFNSPIPDGIGGVETLTSLSLTFCGLTGKLPTTLGSLSLLTSLWLYQNKLTGTIPTSLGSVSGISVLHLEGNLLTGSMPAAVCRLPLTELGADCNGGSVTCSCCTCCGGTACGNFLS